MQRHNFQEQLLVSKGYYKLQLTVLSWYHITYVFYRSIDLNINNLIYLEHHKNTIPFQQGYIIM